jgi:hypothetical protein
VEFAMIVPIVLLVVVSVAELGMVYGDLITVGYGSREGARVGSALATGDVDSCAGGNDPAGVDAAVVSAVQRILKSPGSGLDVTEVQEIRIFKSTSSGAELSGHTNVWHYAGPGGGPEVDPGAGGVNIDFQPIAEPWPACSRNNNGVTPDSIGVTVVYRYRFVSPFASMLDAIAGGATSLTLTETTVMALNPSV